VGLYGDPTLRKTVHAFKFSGVKELSKPLAKALAPRILQTMGAYVSEFQLVPIPLHKRKERSRGYNQAELLAIEIAKIIKLEVSKPLERARFTEAQSSIDADFKDKRKNNIVGAFRFSRQSAIHQKVIIIDDVATTGATIEEAANSLVKNGAEEVWGAVVCRG